MTHNKHDNTGTNCQDEEENDHITIEDINIVTQMNTSAREK